MICYDIGRYINEPQKECAWVKSGYCAISVFVCVWQHEDNASAAISNKFQMIKQIIIALNNKIIIINKYTLALPFKKKRKKRKD